MIQELTDTEIAAIFKRNYYGHLGCCSTAGEPYVVPVTYAYNNGIFYCFSFEGRKLEILRANPTFCFQVEEPISDTKWQSAIAWGTFIELEGESRTNALGHLLDILWEESKVGQAPYFPFRNSKKTLEAAKTNTDVVLFALTVEKQSGRLEVYDS